VLYFSPICIFLLGSRSYNVSRSKDLGLAGNLPSLQQIGHQNDYVPGGKFFFITLPGRRDRRKLKYETDSVRTIPL
jgi:hypothetical protein